MTEIPLTQRLTDEMKSAMRAKDKQRLGTIRLIQAEIKRIEVDERIELDDARVLAILDKMRKQRRDSIEQFLKGDRKDLADIEEAEVIVIEEFLP
ncbi:MAG: GatB/YqeY domain-containing protein, partial [Pseudomonadales bacterium]